MANVQYIDASVKAAVDWAKDHDQRGLLETLFPYEDLETLDKIWERPDLLKDTVVECELRSED